jgi:dihydropteroate synthase-like protein
MGAYMRILLPTGSITYPIVKDAAGEYDADVVITGEIASFLTPKQLSSFITSGSYDLVIVTGMSTASFEDVEQKTGVPVYRGPRHAADLNLILPLLEEIELSRTIPADEFLRAQKEQVAYEALWEQEAGASCTFLLGTLKIGGNSRMKILAEVMDAHKQADLSREVSRFFAAGADIVDLGFGFDATPRDVARCFDELEAVNGPIAIDSQDPELIRAALGRADLVLSLHEANIPLVGEELAHHGTAAVIVPRERTLEENVRDAENTGITRIIVDPLLQPAGSGLVHSLCQFRPTDYPIFFGAGNVTELIDADSIGVNALLAGIAYECGAAVIFTSEHSDKTAGSIGEMRRATEMMALMGNRPYPKDLGIDLLLLKEKRKRREPPLAYEDAMEAEPRPEEIVYDPRGNMRIGIEDGFIVVVHGRVAIRGRRWDDVFYQLLKQDRVSLLDHAAYLGKELYKAQLALRFGRSFEQDGEF